MENSEKDASSGNRTRAARVAGEHSTTEPTMRPWVYGHISTLLNEIKMHLVKSEQFQKKVIRPILCFNNNM